MEYFFQLLPSPALTTALLSIPLSLLFLYYFLRLTTHRKTNTSPPPPEAAGAWPFIGHLRLIAGPEPTHKVLGSLADIYGPIFTIRIGVHRAIVVSNSELAKECFTTNDKVFSNRPKSIALEHLAYNYASFGFSPYGPYWREIRKISVLELLSNHRLATLSHARLSEVRTSVREVYELWVEKEGSCLVEMKRWFAELALRLTVRIIAGDVKAGERCREALREFFEMAGVVTVADALPILRWFDLGGNEKAMKKTAEKLDGILQEWLEEHKRRRGSGETETAEGEIKDFMDVMLEILGGDTRGALGFDADTINKATCLATNNSMFYGPNLEGLTLGGTDTTATTLTWAVALLLNNTHALKKAQDELDFHIGRQRRVEESDMQNLVYIQAIVKETLRLYPPAQLIPPRENTEGCNVGGYHVPKGTRLLVNLWKIHRDPRAWPDPWKFRPERFLTSHKDVDLNGKHFEFLPFGSGRRVCPGISFALQVMQFTLASLLHSFEIATMTDELVDMTESFGFTNVKVTPLEIVLTPCLPPELYV